MQQRIDFGRENAEWHESDMDDSQEPSTILMRGA